MIQSISGKYTLNKITIDNLVNKGTSNPTNQSKIVNFVLFIGDVGIVICEIKKGSLICWIL